MVNPRPALQESAKLSAEVKKDLRALRQLFFRLGGWTLRKIPADPGDMPGFGRSVASMVVTLSIYNRILLRRVFSGEAVISGPEPEWFAETVDWVKLPERQPRRRTVERTMRGLIESLNQHIGALDEATLMRVPARPDEVPEFLTLSVMVQSHLAWYLDVEWFPRVFTFEPPDWVKNRGNKGAVPALQGPSGSSESD